MTAHFEGLGDSIVGPFQLEQGVVSLTTIHSGSSNFIVTLFGSNSEDVLSVNEIGDFRGEQAHSVHQDSFFGLRPGEHQLEITADGSWSIDVLQEFPSGGDPLPFSASGRGNSVLRWVVLEEGNHIMTANHAGQSNFIVEVKNSQGATPELVINEIGNYSGQNRLSVKANSFIGLKPGLHLVAIQADGNWDLSITR